MVPFRLPENVQADVTITRLPATLVLKCTVIAAESAQPATDISPIDVPLQYEDVN